MMGKTPDIKVTECWPRGEIDPQDDALGLNGSRALGLSAKRLIDVSLASMALIALAPLFAVVSLIVKLNDGGPIFYSHRRVGFRGASFGCLKFRTMRSDANAQLADLLRNDPVARLEWETTRKLKDDPRITVVGHILRRSSLDELPQLINVLRGDMSLVGPRPITAEELFRYGEHVGIYLAVRPGLTGHWQISGRNDVSYQARVSMDVDYFQNWSLGRDFLIMAKTVPILFSHRGSY